MNSIARATQDTATPRRGALLYKSMVLFAALAMAAAAGMAKQEPAGTSRGIVAEFLAKSAEERAAIFADPVQKAKFKDEDAKRAFADAFRVFLDKSNYPVIFHCAGGADRTGAIAFILNGILGVSLDDLSKDWELTAFGTGHSVNPDFTHKTRFNRLVAVIDAYPGATLTERIVSYVKSCGFTDADIARVREIMLEPKERNASVETCRKPARRGS